MQSIDDWHILNHDKQWTTIISTIEDNWTQQLRKVTMGTTQLTLYNIWDLSLENSVDSYLCFQLALLHSVSYFFTLYWSTSSSLCMIFYSISIFSQSTHLLIFLSLETLMSIIRTGLPILVELINLVNSVIIFLFQMTLLRWLTFLLRSQTVILIVLLSWIYLFLLMLASVCSTMASPPLGNSDHVIVSVFIHFPSNSQWDAPFHCIAYASKGSKKTNKTNT